ncbi:hypothetical protein T08_12080 [Trichinella sp. T8]|nr:hypothetical protein T08_12080 [Trichinella sp. T8]
MYKMEKVHRGEYPPIGGMLEKMHFFQMHSYQHVKRILKNYIDNYLYMNYETVQMLSVAGTFGACNFNSTAQRDNESIVRRINMLGFLIQIVASTICKLFWQHVHIVPLRKLFLIISVNQPNVSRSNNRKHTHPKERCFANHSLKINRM